MTVYGRKDLVWKKHNLYSQKKLMMSVIPDSKHEKMFRVKWNDGILSEDFYNITWAKEHAMLETFKTLNNRIEDQNYKHKETALEARGCV